MSRLAEIVAALERAQLLVEPLTRPSWPEITGLTADSRKVEPGALYCAVRGSVQDGHQFVAAARQRGAVAALVEREQSVELTQIVVRDGRRAAAVAAETWYRRPAARLDLVGVTGTNGKTTSVTLARHVLGALEPMGSIGTLGAFDPAGVPVPSEAGTSRPPGRSIFRPPSRRSSNAAPAAWRWKSPRTASTRAAWTASFSGRRSSRT
jgi:UDP-N-acetylmuramyl tripeptide synthase